MQLDLLHSLLGLFSGSIVGLIMGLFGGGGSIMAVPLMHFVVGISNPHIVIGTSALAVALNALSNLLAHARNGTVKWRCAFLYSSAGIIGAGLGSSLGKLVDGQKLLLIFACAMVAVAIFMFLSRADQGNPGAECTVEKAPKVVGYGAITGALSGFLGIGGGFLIVPALVSSTGMPILNAIGSSLVSVAAFGLTTSLNYAVSGLVDWPLAIVFVVGGVFGGYGGAYLCKRLSSRKGVLNTAFAGLILIVAVSMFWTGISDLLL